MVSEPDPNLIKAVRRADAERQLRIQAERHLRGVRGQLTKTRRRLLEVLARADAKPKPPGSAP